MNIWLAVGIFIGMVLIVNALPFILFRSGRKDFETYGRFFNSLRNAGKPKTDDMDELHRRIEQLSGKKD
ncbi:MAG: hypothetical protein HYR70_08530 [Chloroflexi bacterium]|nr:hypothetical protein [Chloroflexota bacterium]MBI3339124.1 hypothetical protein [Chloroflexota bacterium]